VVIHKDSYPYLIPGGLIALASGVFAAIGLLEPSRLGWTEPAPLWVKIALAVLLCLPIVWLVAFRLHLRSVWVLRNETPVEMYAQIEVVQDSESTSYYACLRDAPGGAVIHRVPVYALFGKTDLPREPQPAKVFVERSSGKPMVVEMQGKRWWTRAQ
jgi:hypothetical protein